MPKIILLEYVRIYDGKLKGKKKCIIYFSSSNFDLPVV